MRHVAIHLRPLIAGTSTRVDIRVADGPNADAFGILGQAWEPAISRRPTKTQEIMSPDLNGQVQPGRATFDILMAAILSVATPAALVWHGAPVKIYNETAEQDLGASPEFSGTVTGARFDEDYATLSITSEVSVAALDVNFLTLEYDGSGGLGGDAGKRGTYRPAGMGVCKNCEPVWFDETRNIGQLDGYNNLVSVQGCYEGLSSLGASVGDYASYALLAAAIDSHAVPPGRWATCIADGLIGLGAPPTGRVTVHATFGTNRAGAMIRRILQTHAGISVGLIDTAAFAAIDTAVNVPVHYWTADQRNVKELVERVAGSINAHPIVTFQGQITITRGVGGANAGTLNRDGSTEPRVLDWRSADTEAPWWQLKARVARPGVVLSRDEVNYKDTIVDRGAYNALTVYRLGNVVWLADKSSWLYTNATAAAGNAPPAAGAFPASNAWWTQQTPRLGTLANQSTVDWSQTTGIPFEQINNNLLDMTAWKVGRTRNPPGRFDRFILNETTSGTNALVLDTGPFGVTEPMIKAISQAEDVGGGAGGWNYEFGTGVNEVLDPKQSYQLAVWIKMSSMTNFYLGCGANGGGIKNLGGTVDSNPYHEVCLLPQADKWYLAIGLVHGHGYTGGQSGISGIWDPANGRRVFEGVDFKFADATPTLLVHRTYQFYPAAAGKVAWFARPRLDAANGNQPSVEQLLANARTGLPLRTLVQSAAPVPKVVGNRVRVGDSSVSSLWNAAVVGDAAADGACRVSGYVPVEASTFMIGFTDDSAPSPHYSSGDFMLYCLAGAGSYHIYESGTYKGAVGASAPAPQDFLLVDSDDVVVRYYLRTAAGTLILLYTSTVSPHGKKLRPFVSLYTGGVDDLNFEIGNSNQWSNVGDASGTRPDDNADVTKDQPIVSRLNDITGTGLTNFIDENGRTYTRIVQVGSARDGDVITFSPALEASPKVVFLPGGNAATAGQNILIQAMGLTASGFTMKAKSQAVTPGSLVTDGSSTTGGVGEPQRVINRTNGSQPFDNKFRFTFTVTVGTIGPGEPGVIFVSVYVKVAGSWIEVGSGSYSASGTYFLDVFPSTVDFGAGNEFGISKTYSEGLSTAITAFGSVKYTPGTVTETSLTPVGASDIPFMVLLQ